LTLVSEIIRDAYREGNLIAINADPTADEQTEGLSLLNRLIASVYGTKIGEKYEEILIGRANISRPQGYPWYEQVPPVTDWFVPTNTRLILNMTEAQTVYLSPTPEDGARFAVLDKSGNLATYPLTIDANGRTIGGSTTAVVDTDSAANEYVYRADTGDWAIVTPLVASDTFPFPPEFENLFVIGLAFRINPRNGIMADDQSAAIYTSTLKAFKARYRQTEEIGSEQAYVRLPTNKRFVGGDTRRNNSDFNYGTPR